MVRQNWTTNGHIEVDWSRVRVGQVVDHVSVVPRACAVRFGVPVWYVLVVQPNGEGPTTERLADAGVRTFFPKVYKWQLTKELLANGQKRQVKAPHPMFPGYLFVDRRRGLDDFREPLNVKGVRDYLWAEDVDAYGRVTRQPRKLPDGLYEDIQSLEAERSNQVDKDKRKPFKVGETVRIKKGPFRDIIARVEGADSRGRVAILMDIFARPTPTVVDVAQLERV